MPSSVFRVTVFPATVADFVAPLIRMPAPFSNTSLPRIDVTSPADASASKTWMPATLLKATTLPLTVLPAPAPFTWMPVALPRLVRVVFVPTRLPVTTALATPVSLMPVSVLLTTVLPVIVGAFTPAATMMPLELLETRPVELTPNRLFDTVTPSAPEASSMPAPPALLKP